jgi:polar amino acid transport system substrate-binding protein
MKSKRKKGSSLWLLLLAPLIVLVLAACSSASSQEEPSTLEQAQQEGTITVGFANEQPYAYMNEDLELTGVSVDIARRIMENLGVPELEGILTEFSILIPGLQAERFDIVTAGMYITPGRASADSVEFANPEFTIGEAIVVQAGNPQEIYSYEDIAENEEVTVAAVAGTIEYDYLLETGVPEERIISVPDNASALSSLQAGRVDVFSLTEPTVRYMLDQANDPSIEMVEDFQQPVIDGEEVQDFAASVFREEDEEFRQAWNEELRKLEESGELLEILERHDFSEENLPRGTTAEEAIE